MFNIIVLAAGLSRRMGAENKLLLPFKGKTILEVTLNNIVKADLGSVVVVVGHEAEKVKSVLKNYPLPIKSGCAISIIDNLDYEKGMTTSIQAGIRTLSKPKIRNPKPDFMICLSDMPLIASEEYRFLKEAFLNLKKTDKQAIVIPFFKGERGNPVIFSGFYKNALLNLADTEGGKSILKMYPNHVYRVEMPSDSVLKDADTPEDYQRLLA